MKRNLTLIRLNLSLGWYLLLPFFACRQERWEGLPAYLVATVSSVDPYCFGQVVIIHEGQQEGGRMDSRGQLVAGTQGGGRSKSGHEIRLLCMSSLDVADASRK